MSEITGEQFAAVMAAILEVTGARNLAQLEARHVTKEQWRKAYEIADVPWSDYDENWQTH
jgi:hypothetical protein